MHILVLSDEIYPDAIGGVGKSLYNECVALARRGHKVTALVRRVNPALPDEEQINGLRVIRFRGPSRDNRLYYLYPLWTLDHVTQWLRRNPGPYDVIYIHSPLFMPPLLLSGVRRQAPVVTTFYARADDYIESNISRGKYGALSALAGLGARAFGLLERWALGQVDAVLPRSRYSLDMLQRDFPAARVHATDSLIPLGVDVAHYRQYDRAETRRRLDLPADRPILITVRRLDGRMGLENLIEAVRQVREKHPDVLALIGGKGYLRPRLEALIAQHGLADHVRLLGFVSEDDLPLYLAASDLFVLPTESLEGFGLATIEALASGTPVLGTPAGATPELLTSLDPALVTLGTKAADLADGIGYWLDRRDELIALGERSRAAAEALYDADQVAAQLEQYFAALNRR